MFDWFRRGTLAKLAFRRYERFLHSFGNVQRVVISDFMVSGSYDTLKILPKVCIRVFLKGRKLPEGTGVLAPAEQFFMGFQDFKFHGKLGRPYSVPRLPFTIPKKLFGIPTDVTCIEKGIRPLIGTKKKKGKALAAGLGGMDTKTYPWLGGGMAMSGQTIYIMGSFGTSALFCVPTKNVDEPGKTHLLSNGHVSPKKKETVYQGLPGKAIGKNGGTIYPLDYPDDPLNPVPADASLTCVNSGLDLRDEIVELGPYETEYHEPQIGRIVVKRGATKYGTSEYVTQDAISDGPASIRVGYDESADGARTIGNTWGIGTPINRPHGGGGCSGSLENDLVGIVGFDGKLYPCGELYAGGDDEQQGMAWTFFYDLGAPGSVMEHFGIKTWGLGGGNGNGNGDGEPTNCLAQENICMVKADEESDLLTRFILYLFCVLDGIICVIGQGATMNMATTSLKKKSSRIITRTHPKTGLQISVGIKRPKVKFVRVGVGRDRVTSHGKRGGGR